MSDYPPSPNHAPGVPAESKVLGYARPRAVGQCPWRLVVVAGGPVGLTVASFAIFTQAGHDEGPFFPDWSQSSLYLGIASILIELWACWAVLAIHSLIRRSIETAWVLLLVAGLLWGGLMCFGLYENAADYIDQTTRIHGADWPILKHVVRK